MSISTLNLIFYIFIILIPLFTELLININYKKYKKINNKKKLTGFDIAKKILEKNNLDNIYIVEINGNLTDHYDTNRKVIKLSKDVFHGEKVTSLAIAAHECGHALQDKENYSFLKIRSILVPVIHLTSSLSWIVIIIGLFAEYFNLFLLGIGLISITLLFQLITLPVSFNASKRAKKELKRLKLTVNDEDKGVNTILISASLTYVASILTAIFTIIRLLLINHH